MKVPVIFAFLGATLLAALAETPAVPPDQRQHKQTSGEFPYTQGTRSDSAAQNLVMPSTPSPESGHAIDKRYPKRVKDTQVTLTFPGDDAGAVDSRPCAKGFALDTLLSLHTARRPQAARDGGVFFLSDPLDTQAAPQLFYQPEAHTEPKALTALPLGVSDFRVSPDGKRILLLTQAENGTRVALWDTQRGQVSVLLEGQVVPAVAWSQDSRWFAYTSNARDPGNLDLYRYDLTKKQPARLAELSGFHEVTDISPDDRAIAITERRSPTDSDVQIWTAGSVDTISRAGGPARASLGKFTGDGRSVFFLSDAEKPTPQLYLRSLMPGQKAKLLTSETAEIEDFDLDTARSALIYRINNQGYSDWGGWEIDRHGGKRALLNLPKLPGVVVSLPSFTRGSHHGAFFYARSGSDLPPMLWRWDFPRNEPWSEVAKSPIPRACFARGELVHYPSFDGRSIAAFLFPSRAPTSDPAFIVVAHDGPDAQFRPEFHGLVQFLLQRGYGVLAPNVRGSTGYGRDFLDLDNGHNRWDAARDIGAAGQWLLEQQYVRSSQQLAVIGENYGGYLALAGAESVPGLYRAAVTAGAWLNLATAWLGFPPAWRYYRQAEFGAISDLAFLRSVSPATRLATLRTAALLFTAAGDPLAPPEEAAAFAQSAKAGGVTVELKSLGGPHRENAPTRWSSSDLITMAYFIDDKLKTGRR